jgi:hypothetical protein
MSNLWIHTDVPHPSKSQERSLPAVTHPRHPLVENLGRNRRLLGPALYSPFATQKWAPRFNVDLVIRLFPKQTAQTLGSLPTRCVVGKLQTQRALSRYTVFL